jgi:hypothetical protein
MRTIGVLVAVFLVGELAAAHGQPGPPPPAPPPPVVEEEPKDVVRWGIGGGLSGTLGNPRDVRGTAGLEVQYDRRIDRRVSWGIHTHLSLRNWKVIGDFYKSMSDCHGSECAYGYIFGWLAGTGLVGLGPEIMIHSASKSGPFVTFGTSALISIDTRDEEEKVVFAHAGHTAVGIDFGGGGIAVRGQYAPSADFLLGSTGSPVFSLMATLEVRVKPKKK